MKPLPLSLAVILGCGIVVAAGCGHKDATPQLSARDQQKIAQQQRQNALDRQIYDINNSNLPPDQKQRMIDQIRTSGPQ